MVKVNNIGINTKFSPFAVLEAIPSDSKLIMISLLSSLVRLSLVNNNLYTESFPMDFSCLSMLEALNLDKNHISCSVCNTMTCLLQSSILKLH